MSYDDNGNWVARGFSRHPPPRGWILHIHRRLPSTRASRASHSVYSTLTFSAYHPICTSCVDCSETTTLHLRESRSSIHQAKISITSPLSPHIRNPCAALNHSISSNALTLLSTLLPPSTAWKLCTLSSADIIKNVCNPNVRTVCACPPELFAGEPEASG
jgi:hypothetical protein